jgi:hypothetical protein
MAMVASPHHQVRERVRACLLECEREKDREEKAAAAAGGRRDRDDDDAALPKEAPPHLSLAPPATRASLRAFAPRSSHERMLCDLN